MTELEEFLKQMTFDLESEAQIDKIIEDMEKNGIGLLNEDTVTQDMYIVNPFLLLSFSQDGNGFSNSMVNYCKKALEFFNKHRAVSPRVSFVPPLSTDNKKVLINSTCFTEASIRFVLSKNSDGIKNLQPVRDFFKITQSQSPKYTFTEVKAESFFKEHSKASFVFVPKNMAAVSTNGYLNNAESPVSIDYSTSIYELIPKIRNLAENVSTHKELVEKCSDTKNCTFAQSYLLYLIDYCMQHPSEVDRDIQALIAGDSKQTTGFGKSFGSGADNAYKNNKLNRPESGTLSNLDGTVVGDFAKWTAANAGSSDDSWQKTLNNFKHTMDKKTLDSDVEKFYNAKHLVKDAFGIEDTDARYDSRRYEGSPEKKIKDVSGYDIYKLEKKKEKYTNEIDKIDLQLLDDDAKLSDKEKEKLITKKNLYNQDIAEIQKKIDYNTEMLNHDKLEKAVDDKTKKDKDKDSEKKIVEPGIGSGLIYKTATYINNNPTGKEILSMLQKF